MHEDAVPGTVAVPLPPRPLLARAVYPLIIVVVICAVYSQAVRFDFLSYDDYDLISQNTDYLGNLRNLAASFTTHVFSTHRAESAYYRPLLLVSFIIDYRLWGLNPFGFHLVNVLLHAAAALVDLGAIPGNRLEALAGDRKGQHSIRINDQWRICFRWVDSDASDVEIVDYH